MDKSEKREHDEEAEKYLAQKFDSPLDTLGRPTRKNGWSRYRFWLKSGKQGRVLVDGRDKSVKLVDAHNNPL